MSSRTPSRLSSRPGSSHSRTPSRVEVVVNGHFVSPSTHRKGDMPIDPELLAMDDGAQPGAMANGDAPGSDVDAEGSDEDAEGEAVDEELEYSPWPMAHMPVEPAPSFYATSQVSDSSRNEAGPSRLPDLTAAIHGQAPDPQSLSPSSATPAPKKRGRPPRAQTSVPPNGTIIANGHAPDPSLKVKLKAVRPNGKPKGKGRAYDQNGIVVADPFCSFCSLTAERNKQGRPESMVSCHLCGRSGHFSCLEMKSPELIRMVQSYDWTCIECKTCEECQLKENEDELMFCDGCDKGWHFACASPPLKRLPKGSWRCHHCRARVASSHAGPSSLPTPDPPQQKYKGKGKGKGKAFEGYTHFQPPPLTKPPAPPKARKSTHAPSDPFDDSHTPKPKPPRRPKMKPGTSTPGYSPTPEAAPPPRINIRLRIPARHRSAEMEEPEEEKVPYGGVIEGADADTSKTTIVESDKLAFERSRRIAEDKLGGPPPGPSTTSGGGTWDTPGHGSPGSTPGPSRSQSMANITPVGRSTPQPQPSVQHSLSRSLRDRLFTQALPSTPGMDPHHASPSVIVAPSGGTGPSQKINKIRFGAFDIDTWYSAPYPEEYQYVPEGRLWLCEFCLKFMKSGFVAGRHRMKCKARHPPGDEIYRDGNVSVFEVDGRKNKIYCQNLCLLAKMFLDHKTLYYDVEPFLFYVMTEVDDLGARFVGYFSKEKRSPDNNVSCIMTLPVRQRKGWGQLLIDFSYLLSKKEGRVGSPEKPLSGLGAVTYKKYWQLSVFGYLRDKTGTVTIEDISAATSMTPLDVYTTLRDEDLIRVQPAVIPIRRPLPTRGRGRGNGRGRGSARGRQSLLRNSSQAEIDEPEPSPLPQPTHADETEIKVPALGTYEIVYDRDYVLAVLAKHAAKGHLELRPERLKYHPFLVSRNMPLKVGGNVLELAAAAIADTGTADDDDSGRTAVDAINAAEGKEDGVVDGEEGGVGKVVLNGEDPETLALVAALSTEQSPKRSLRKRTSLSEERAVGEAGRSKRVRRSTRGGPVVVLARRGRSSGMIAVPDAGAGEGVIVIDGDEEEEVVEQGVVEGQPAVEKGPAEEKGMEVEDENEKKEEEKGVEEVEEEEEAVEVVEMQQEEEEEEEEEEVEEVEDRPPAPDVEGDVDMAEPEAQAEVVLERAPEAVPDKVSEEATEAVEGEDVVIATATSEAAEEVEPAKEGEDAVLATATSETVEEAEPAKVGDEEVMTTSEPAEVPNVAEGEVPAEDVPEAAVNGVTDIPETDKAGVVQPSEKPADVQPTQSTSEAIPPVIPPASGTAGGEDEDAEGEEDEDAEGEEDEEYLET